MTIGAKLCEDEDEDPAEAADADDPELADDPALEPITTNQYVPRVGDRLRSLTA